MSSSSTFSFALIKQIKFSPYKINLILQKISNLNCYKALEKLMTYNTKASDFVWNLLNSAISNFRTTDKDLKIAECFVTRGKIIKRFQPRAKGRSYLITKKHSNIYIKIIYGSKN